MQAAPERQQHLPVLQYQTPLSAPERQGQMKSEPQAPQEPEVGRSEQEPELQGKKKPERQKQQSEQQVPPVAQQLFSSGS